LGCCSALWPAGEGVWPVCLVLPNTRLLPSEAPTRPNTPQVDDLFPGLDCPRVRYPRLNDEVEAELAAAGYQARIRGPRAAAARQSDPQKHAHNCYCRWRSGLWFLVVLMPAANGPTLCPAQPQVLTAPGDQVDKVVQLYEVMLTRHTTMVVGQTGGGKSVILQALARAQVRAAGGPAAS
jgi:dynein heavy chain, axonemal